MALHQDTLDKRTVMRALEETVHTLEHDDGAIRLNVCDSLGIGTAEWEACREQLIEELQSAEEWVVREETLEAVATAPPVDSQHGPEFVPSHATLALFQSALNEHLDATGDDTFHPRDVKWLSMLYQRLRTQVRGKAPFIQHARPDDFRVPLGERSTVALVSDWGTGNVHAAAVAAQIRHRDPDHVIHLGDVYYTGSSHEMREHFLGMWRNYGPLRARYWALNGNHDMYSGGHAYFSQVLPAFRQPASYFNLQNRHWRLVALDSAYVNHTFTGPQMEWFEAQLSEPTKTVLLTHHHLLSGFRRRGDKLEEWLDPYLASGRLFGWFWGHDHFLIEYAEYRGVKCRCIGHGSIPYVPPDRQRQTHPAPIVRMETRPSPLAPSRGMHGFALLTFDGPALQVEYVDEQGGTAWTERWP